MREILFRGKRLYNGEWVYGNLVIDKNDKPHIVPKDYFYEDGHHLQYYDDTDKPVFIDPETVGQFTGLTDKNGTKIFEGDIVKDEYILGKVVYNTKQEDFDGAASFMIDDVDDGLQSYRFWNSVEVIGNIHDNPELLGVQTMAEYIDRKKAYDYATLEDWYINSVTDDLPIWTEEHLEELLNDFYVIPKDTPTADVVEVKHGKWVERENNYDTYYDCSVCSESFVFIDGDPIDNLYQYCPNCGAKMDGKGGADNE